MPVERYDPHRPKPNFVEVGGVRYRVKDWVEIVYRTVLEEDKFVRNPRWNDVFIVGRVFDFLSGGPPNGYGMCVRDLDGEVHIILSPNVQKLKKRARQ